MNEKQDFEWLVSAQARPFLSDVQCSIAERENILRVAKRLRREMTSQRAAAVLEMAQLRIRGRKKFQRADEMFFTRRSLEQASGEDIAHHKSLRFRVDGVLADICCGIGGDLLALAQRAFSVGIDKEPVTALFAAANLRVNDLPGESRCLKFEEMDSEEFAAFHFDPSRRNHGRKTVGDLLQPSLPSILEWIPEDRPTAIKVAPATPVHHCTPPIAEWEWIGDGRECKQQVIWLGGAQTLPGGRTATVIKDGKSFQFSPPVGSEQLPQNLAAGIGDYVYEPHATILASGLTDAMAAKNDLARLAKNVAYLTGGDCLESPLMSKFQVIDVLPMEVKKIARELVRLDAGVVEYKRRSVSDVFYDAFKRIKTRGSKSFVVLLSPTLRESVAIIAKRVREL
ncbi:MAG: class I SAM-dependent methyltransferase [Mariniblastus sp.]|nr:class I SAM-dependent methyltransferase [Mariniblastus sp.]